MSQRFELVAVDLMRWPCGRDSANELGRTASRLSPHHNQVRTAQCTRACSVGGRPILNGAISARAVRHGSRTR